MIHRFIDEVGGRISPPFAAFEDTSLDGDTNIYREHFDDAAGNATRYTDWNDGGSTVTECFNPVLSPDLTKIAFVARLDFTGQTALYVVDNTPNSSATLLLSDPDQNINTPMWSPDSSKLVFTRGTPTGNNYGGIIESIPATGGSTTVLHTPATNYRAFRPAYSYNGAYIAFNVQHGTGIDHGLWVMAANGTGPSEIDGILGYNGDGSQFGWANGSLKIAYDDGSGISAATPRVVYTINHDGTGKTTVSTGSTNGAANRCGKFCWSADDSEVIVTSNQGSGYFSLFSVDPGGGGDTLLNASHGASGQTFCRGAFVFEDRIWFIETASGANGGRLGSVAMDGTDYTEELDVNDASFLDWFGSGTGFEFQ